MGVSDQASAKVRKATRLALNEIGRRAVKHIRQKIDIPVEYIGSEVIRSEPGEPPRREFRRLQKSVKYRVQPKAKTIEDLIVYTAYLVAFFLEYGTLRIEPRPFWEVSRREIYREAVKLFKQLLKEFLDRETVKGGDDFAGFSAANDAAYPE